MLFFVFQTMTMQTEPSERSTTKKPSAEEFVLNGHVLNLDNLEIEIPKVVGFATKEDILLVIVLAVLTMASTLGESRFASTVASPDILLAHVQSLSAVCGLAVDMVDPLPVPLRPVAGPTAVAAPTLAAAAGLLVAVAHTAEVVHMTVVVLLALVHVEGLARHRTVVTPPLHAAVLPPAPARAGGADHIKAQNSLKQINEEIPQRNN